MSEAISSSAARIALAGVALFSLSVAGCGNNYRPVVTATNPVGPSGQPLKYAIALSVPNSTTPGLLTFVNVFGDTVISTPSVQNNPTYFAITSGGGEGYTINAAGQLDEFSAGSPASLLTSNISQTTLASNATPVTITPVTLSGSTATVYLPEAGTSRIAALNNSNQLVQEITVPATPLYVVGSDGTSRLYALSSNGTASSIEASTNAGLSITATLPVGANPTYGVMTPDTRRAFILNKGSQSVSVINVVNNAIDTGIVPGLPVTDPNYNPNAIATGTIGLPNTVDGSGNLASAANPIWADFNPTTNELMVLSQGDGVHAGVLTVINIPLCSATAQSNPNCSSTNPVDAVGFGRVLASIPVGVNPQMVSVLRDTLTPRAYVANAGNGTTNGSVSVVNLNSFVVTATLPTIADTTNLASTSVFGLHPATIAATVGDPTGKVYVTSTDSRNLTVISTESDTVTTHIPLQGYGLRVLVTAP